MATGLKAGRSQARDGAPAPRRPTLREQQKQFTRDRLLTAALAAFVENGYTPARIEDVAARAGASRATFYLHFGGKAEIVHALMDRVEPQEETIWEALCASGTTRARADVHRWLRALTLLWEANRSYFAMLEQAVAVEPSVAARYAAARRRRTKLVALGSETRALLLVVQLERVCQLWLDGEGSVDRRSALDELAGAWAAI